MASWYYFVQLSRSGELTQRSRHGDDATSLREYLRELLASLPEVEDDTPARGAPRALPAADTFPVSIHKLRRRGK